MIKPSELDGRTVSYTDFMKLTHRGTIIGQSPDGQWFFVQSSDPNVKPAEWHFKIAKSMIDAVLVVA